MTEEVRKCVEVLRYCEESGACCGGCPSGKNEQGIPNCYSQSHIADLIESLSAQLDQVTRERDAAVKGLARYRGCIDCARYDEEIVKTNPLCDGCSFGSKWQLRGVEVEG